MNTITALFLLVLAVYLTMWAAQCAIYDKLLNVLTWWMEA